jgi:diguanylate cyclase (GGDEF)-like protein/PAS domain S-box-containing protein
VDTVADGDGRKSLSRHASEERHSEGAKQATFLDPLPAHIALLDAQGIVVSVNDAWRRFASADAMLGPGYGIGHNYLDICKHARVDSPSDARRVAEGIRSVLTSGAESFSIEYSCHLPMEQRWFLLTVTPLADDRPSGAVVMHLDITEQKRDKDELRESERRFSDMLGNVDLISLMLDSDARITYCNDYLLQLTGWRREEVMGRDWFELFIPFGGDDVKELFAGLLAGLPYASHYENEILTRTGERRLIHWNNSTLRSSAGEVIGTASIGDDITERKGAEKNRAQMESTRRLLEEALRESEERYRMLLDGIHDYAIFMMDPRGQIVSWNAGAERIKGYKADQIIGQNFSCFFPPADIERGRPEEILRMTAASGRHEEQGMRVRKDGSQFLASVTFTALRDPAGNLRGFSEFSHDLSESQESVAKYRGLLEAAPDAMVVVNQRGEIVLLNVQAENQFGYSRDELVGQKVQSIIPEGFAERLIADGARSAADALAQQIGTGIELSGRRKDGSEFPIEIMLSPLKSAEGTLVTTAIRDISVRKNAEAQITHSAQHDSLTGLPNRVLLNDRIGQAIASAARYSRQIAVLCLDLDGFKHLNNSLGRSIGDRLLQSVAKRLQGCVRTSDTVSRLGGDEFVVLLSEAEQWEDAAFIAGRMLESVAQAYSIDGHDLHVTASIGVSLFSEDGPDAETLIKNADNAMYQAKQNGHQSYQFFKPEMNVRAVERQSLEEGLRRALERQEFLLHYQPKISLRTGAITGAEALIRWRHPTRGLVSPAEFIPVAEECGLIGPIGDWVLHEASTQARAWVHAGLPVATMAVNVSAMQLRDGNFLEGVFAVLKDTGLDGRSLDLELTESVLMNHAESTASILRALREAGIRVTIDDFGTGYSSLSYLRRFPIDAIKIDRSFVSQIAGAGDDAAIVTAVIEMARSLKLRVIAEGVETQEQLVFLRTHRCDEAQGYYFSRPVLPEKFAELLEAEKRARTSALGVLLREPGRP